MNEIEKFPKWKYHREKTAKIFYTKEEFEKAGTGWVDSPAMFVEKEEKPVEPVKEQPADKNPEEKSTNKSRKSK